MRDTPTRALPDPWKPTEQVADTWAVTQATDPKTQLLADRESDAASDGAPGRHVGAHLWEMFVVFDPAQALQMQLEQRRHEFVAVHDLGGGEARRWMAAVAAERGWPVHRLVMRSQGYGVALATIEFIELPVTEGPPLRLYSTDVDADARQRAQLARMLLAASRLATVMVGDLPPHALHAALRSLDEMVAWPQWRNRHLLVCPLAAGAAVALRASQIAAGTPIEVSTTPPVPRSADAYGSIVQSWNALRRQAQGAGPALPELVAVSALPPEAPAAGLAGGRTAPLAMQPMPELKRPAESPAVGAPQTLLQRYARQCLDVRGMISCCVFDVTSQRTLGFAGARPGPAALATQGAAMYAMIVHGSRALGLGVAPPQAAVTLAGHHLVLRPLPQRPGVLLHAVLDRSATPLSDALSHLDRLDTLLVADDPPSA